MSFYPWIKNKSRHPKLAFARNLYIRIRFVFLKKVKLFFLVPVRKRRHFKLVCRLRKKEKKLSVLFIVQHTSQWKYQGLLELMIQSQIYDPHILIAPDPQRQNWTYDQKVAVGKFSRDSNVGLIFAYDALGEFCLSSKDLSFDIVFFPKSIEGKNPLSIMNFKNSLCCYVPYSTYGDNNPELQYNRIFHNLLWKHYVATEIHQKMSLEVSFNRASNVVVSGYPAFDLYLHAKSAPKPSGDSWPSTEKYKIIWAPHHSIEESEMFSNHSTFLRYSQFFQNLVQQFQDEVFFAFKPHPNLRKKLYDNNNWGQKRTDQYYEFWDQEKNSMLVEGTYEKLFLGSDAIIHDSVSFMAEYLCLKKPACYLVKNEKNHKKFLNEFGLLLLEVHKHALSEEDITDFISIVMAGEKVGNFERSHSEVVKTLNPHPEIPSSKVIFEDLNIALNPGHKNFN